MLCVRSPQIYLTKFKILSLNYTFMQNYTYLWGIQGDSSSKSALPLPTLR